MVISDLQNGLPHLTHVRVGVHQAFAFGHQRIPSLLISGPHDPVMRHNGRNRFHPACSDLILKHA